MRLISYSIVLYFRRGKSVCQTSRRQGQSSGDCPDRNGHGEDHFQYPGVQERPDQAREEQSVPGHDPSSHDREKPNARPLSRPGEDSGGCGEIVELFRAVQELKKKKQLIEIL